MSSLPTLTFPNAVPQELATIGDWWRFSVSSLARVNAQFGQGSSDAGQDSVFLVLGALDLPLDSYEQMKGYTLTGFERKHVFNALRQRIIDRMPTAYILGFVEQMGLRFAVDQRVLIPRSFIGELLDTGLPDFIPEPDQIDAVLDLCTGSGCLAILAAHAFTEAAITASDISEQALQVAQVNVTRHGFERDITLIKSDLFERFGEQRFDLILSNPPYVTAHSMAALPEEFRQEPSLALAAGVDGNDMVRRILSEAKRHLSADGLLIVDVGHNRHLVEDAFPTLPFMWLATAASDAGVFLIRAEQLA